jgi:Flp pilus assembly protein TadG
MWKGLRRRAGHELTEYALVLPLVLGLILGVIDLALVVYSYESIENAAREGARYGVVHPTDLAGIESAARTFTVGLDQDALNVTVSYPGSNLIKVGTTYTTTLYTAMIIQAFGGSPTLQLQAAALMQME